MLFSLGLLIELADATRLVSSQGKCQAKTSDCVTVTIGNEGDMTPADVERDVARGYERRRVAERATELIVSDRVGLRRPAGLLKNERPRGGSQAGRPVIPEAALISFMR